MSDEVKGYKIIPSKVNPKIGLVVNLIPDIPIKAPMSQEERNQLHYENNREGYRAEIKHIEGDVYRLFATHKFHFLQYQMHMEKGTDQIHMPNSLLCDFLMLDIDNLNSFIDDDDFL